MGLMYDVIEKLRADMDRQERDLRQLLWQLTQTAGHAPAENRKEEPDNPEGRERSDY